MTSYQKYLAIFVVVCWAVFGFFVGRATASPPQGWGAASLEVAYEYWGTDQPPLCTSETIHWGEEPPQWGGVAKAAATAPLHPEPCTMWIGNQGSAYTLCLVVVHEYSHWMGYQWGTDPKSVTYDGEYVGDASEAGTPWEPEVIQGCWKLVTNGR